MLRIEKVSTGSVTRLLVSGCLQSDSIPCIQSAMNDGRPYKILDLGEVTIVDVGVVRFLIRCEKEGIELAVCPPYVREWILREHAEGAKSEPRA